MVGVSSIPPNDLPTGYSDPEKCRVPATPSLTRAQLKVKNELWPTVFTPHLLPTEIKFTSIDVERIKNGMQLAVNEAIQARAIGEVGSACLSDDPESVVDPCSCLLLLACFQINIWTSHYSPMILERPPIIRYDTRS